VLSFAMNSAHDAQEGNDLESCEDFQGCSYEACVACCKLLGEADNWAARLDALEEGLCVCVENEALDP
jgi:hypothetical protein